MVNYILKLIFDNEKEQFCKLISRIHNFKEYHVQFEGNEIKVNTEEYKILAVGFLFDIFMKKQSNSINIKSFIEQYNN